MIQINEELISHLASLSRIACTKQQAEGLVQDLSKIVGYFEQLSEVDVEDVAPLEYVSEFIQKAPLRPDNAQNTLSQEQFLKQAPQAVAQMVRIPAVIQDYES